MHTPYLRQHTIALTRDRSRTLTLALVLGLAVLLMMRSAVMPTTVPAPVLSVDFGQLPLAFVPNAGQTDPAVRFQVHDRSGTIFFTTSEIVLTLPATEQAPSSVVRLRYEGANPNPKVVGLGRLPGIVNYFIGNDPAQWHTNLPTYAGIVYQHLYPGIDLRYEGTSGRLKGTYIIAPGADPARIRWRHDGATSVRLDESTGDLLIALTGATLIEHAPIAWQEINGQRVSVAVRYVLGDDGNVGFALGSYDPTQPLTIDPTMSYGTYLGGSLPEEAEGIAVDGAGNAYVVGTTHSTDFPTTAGSYQPSFPGGNKCVFIAKISATGDAWVYSTYLGGSGDDEGHGIAVDSEGNAYITGATNSPDFPTQNPFQDSCALFTGVCTGDAFVAKLNAAGDGLVYSTYLGGSFPDEAKDIAVDSAGNAYVTGFTSSADFPTKNPLQGPDDGSGDAFVTKLNSSGDDLVYSTYLGGNAIDGGAGIVVDSAGNAYVVGSTTSADFPTTTGAFDTTCGTDGDCDSDGGLNPHDDAFVAKLNADGDALVYSTYLGGSDEDYSHDIAVDSAGNAHVTGRTESVDFPTTMGAFDTTCGTDGSCNDDGGYGKGGDAFVTKLNADGSDLLYSTYLGGSGDERGRGIAVDNADNAYVTGDTYSDDFPTQNTMQAYGGETDAFVVKFETDGSGVVYSTYLGGSSGDYGTAIAVDGDGNAYVTGVTGSEDFPTQNPLQAAYHGYWDAFVVKLEGEVSPPPTPGPDLTGSYKSASQHTLFSGETLTYTIYLINSGTVTATADVTDPVPAEMNYVLGSATEGGVYDPGTDTLTWNDVTVGPEEEKLLSFVVTATTVTTPTMVTNTATISADGDLFDRHAWVLLLPPPPPGPDLTGSYKSASQYTLFSGETLTYTIHLINSGTVTATADVTDPIPAEMNYVLGSATEGGVYDPGTDTLTWNDVTIGPGEDKSLSFVVTATTVAMPTMVKNTAIISADGDLFERHVWVLVLPPPPPSPHLRGSHKTASQYMLFSGETLTYTIHLVNSGTVTATADVTDPIPAEMNYVLGSATEGGIYDPDTDTLTWNDVTVGPGEDKPLSFVVTATTVAMPTVVRNTATISADGDLFERHVLVLVLPPLPSPYLRGSHKTASQYMLFSGEPLTYTIHLINSGTVTATADVTDPVPAEMNYVLGSATEGGVYDPDTDTLTWNDVTVGPGEEKLLSFVVTATSVTTPTLVVNKATIAADGDSFERQVTVLVVPEPTGEDVTPPVVDSLTIDDQDVLTDPVVTLYISASDDVAVTEMNLREWLLVTSPVPHWKVVQTSGWISYQTTYTWTLTSDSGTHFVGVWVADEAGNVSTLNRNGLDYASLLLPGETIPRFGMIPYLVYYDAGVNVTATLTTLSGDADLYVWFPDNFGPPDEYSIEPGTVTDEVTFTTPKAGTYLFLVYGYKESTFDLSITPGGGPRAWAMARAQTGPTHQAASAEVTASGTKQPLNSEPVLTWSGLDPLSDAEAPSRFMIYLPLIANRSAMWPGK